MPFEYKDYYNNSLSKLHAKLISSEIYLNNLTAKNVFLDKKEMVGETNVDLLHISLPSIFFCHLFCIFNDSIVTTKHEYEIGNKATPVGRYYTHRNIKYLAEQQENSVGVNCRRLQNGKLIHSIHIDHFFLRDDAPTGLATVAIPLMLITAHLAEFKKVSLIAAGGGGRDPAYVGFNVWPKFGFDAKLEPEETGGAPHLARCRTVQDVLAADPNWWTAHGTQRMMSFDLTASSASWNFLLAYLGKKFKENFL